MTLREALQPDALEHAAEIALVKWQMVRGLGGASETLAWLELAAIAAALEERNRGRQTPERA